MEDFGDYIYLLVILAAAVGSLFKKSKKKVSKQIADNPHLPDLSDVISEENKDYIQKESQKNFQEIIAEKFKTTQSTFTTINQSLEDSKSYAKAKKNDDLHTDEEDENEWMSTINLENTDEAKKAFIYSEIMTRKYS